MSTKIYDGFRLCEGVPLEQFTSDLRRVLDPVRDSEDVKMISRLVTESIDRRWLRGETVPAGAAAATCQEWHEAQGAMSPRDWDHHRNRFELSIGTDPGTGRVMMIARSENSALMAAFQNMDAVEEYGYWNNSDSYPDGVTEADWEVREAAWNRMLPGAGKISDTMDTWVLRESPAVREGLLTPDLLAGHAPDRQSRAETLGREAYAEHLISQHGIEAMTAVQHVIFNRGADVSPVIDLVAAYLPRITAELLTGGTQEVIAKEYRELLRTACASLYELDKAKLEGRR